MTNIALAMCAKEYGVPQPIAMGAATVFINGMPAARKTDKLVCSAQIIQGSGDVFYDDKTLQTLDISPEVPQWLNTTLQVVAVGALVVGFGAAVVAVGFGAATAGLVGGLVGGELGSMGGRALGKALGLSEAGQRAMEMGGGFLGGLLGGSTATRAYEGFGTNPEGVPTPRSDEVCTNGCPISMHTGEELLTLVDFTWQGPLALSWKRFYRTSQSATDLQAGHGWLTPLDEWVEPAADGSLAYHDREGRFIALPLPPVGGHGTNVAERLRIERSSTHLRIRGGGGPDRLFAFRAGRCRLSAWESKGHRITVERDAAGCETALRASWGKALLISRDGHRIGQIMPARSTREGFEPIGAPLVRYVYDAGGDLTGALDRLDEGERYAYEGHLITRRTLPPGFSFRFEWDAAGGGARCLRNWGDEGIYDYRFEWAPERGFSRVVDARGGTTDYVHDRGGRLLQVTSPEGRFRAMRYDGRGLLAEILGPLGVIERLAHDGEGRLVERRDASGGVRALSYDLRGRVASATDAAGGSATWQYDDDDRLLRVTDATGAVTRYAYNAQGLLAQEEDALGRVRRLWWDDQARPVAELGFDGVRRYFSYDADDRVAAVTTQEKRTRRFEWDATGRLVGHTNEAGERIGLRYAAGGRLTHWIDAQGRRTEYRYGVGLLQPSERIDPLGRCLRYEFDAERNLVALVNAKGERRTLDWDLDGRLVAETGFDGLRWRYEHDADGQVVAQAELLDGTWAVTCLARDERGLLVAKQYADGTQHRFAYDPAGRLASAASPGHEVTFAYDAAGRMIEERQGDAVIRHRRDALGRRVATILPDGRVLGIAWDRNGRPREIALDGRPLTQHRFDEFAQEVEREQGALVTRYAYDPAGRLAAHHAMAKGDGRVLFGREYRRDADGGVVGVHDLVQGDMAYVYDPASQLLEARGLVLERFAYDPAGNLVDEAGVIAAGDRLSMQGDRHFRYDAAGNRIEERRGTAGGLITRYEYDAAHRLVAVHAPRSTSRYSYDALGRRIAKVVGGQETRFAWDGATLIGEATNDARGELVRWYVYEPGSFRPLACVQRRRASVPRLAVRDGRAAVETPPDDAVFHFHLDHLGTPLEVTDARGRVAWSGRHRAWGALAVTDVEDFDNRIRFQGQYEDGETGLHYNFQRYYDPQAGRFLTQDPFGLAGGPNPYRYAPNPVGWTDPWGLVCTHEASDAGEAYAAIQDKWGRTPSANDMRELDATIGRAQVNDRSAYPLKDGSPFENSPAISPNSQRLNSSGSYEEWTVKTPGVGNRGTRRLVIDRPNRSAYYSDDHYDSFVDVSGWVFP